jgi:mono/diheme cytochrome c family protein
VARLAWVILFCGIALTAPAEELDQSAVRGRSIAVSICSSCHVVASDQPYPPILRHPGPSFQAIANKPADTGDTLRRFIATTHKTAGQPFKMPNPELTDDMRDQVVAYILSLRNQR